MTFKRIILSGLLIMVIIIFDNAAAQTTIFKPAYLKYEFDSAIKEKILVSLDTLFSQIARGKINPSMLSDENDALSISTMQSFVDTEANKRIDARNTSQLINLYPISTNKFWISLALLESKSNETPVLKNIINIVATHTNGNITFSIPLYYLTKNWKTKTVGSVTYFFSDKINTERAIAFNEKNTKIATKLGLLPEKLNFYLCNNYQEILKLLGYEYDAESNGKVKGGYGVDSKTIFSIMSNEDFSHDVFHYYSEIIRGDIKPNRTVEEGLAYSWGNAYYTNANGEMIDQKELIERLKIYLTANPKVSLLELFNKDIKIFYGLPHEVSTKSTIAGLLCNHVESEEGIDGIIALIECGRGDDNFFKILNNLVSINQRNFDTEVIKLIENDK